MIRLVPVSSVLAELRPRPSIDLGDPSAADQWAQKLNVSRDRLVAAIQKVGNSVAAVRRELQVGPQGDHLEASPPAGSPGGAAGR